VNKRLIIGTALLVLIAVYLLQRFSYAHAFNSLLPESLQIVNRNTIFVINKTIRLILNDVACVCLIYALFPGRNYLRAAFYLFLIELFIILPVYFGFKLSLEGDSEISSPLLSQVHRLIVNPLLMFLLMIGFLHQRLKQEKS
jgi:exosortase F-associated protein